jgi:hypothetical protein
VPIAYSQRTIIKASIRADTSAHFRADIDSALTAAGWTVARTVTNGKVYQSSAAPVSTLALRMLVQDQGTGSANAHWIVFQAMSSDESVMGLTQTIAWGALGITVYQVIVGCCQFFISIPGRVGSGIIGDQSGAFACGVPSLPFGSAGPGCEVNGVLPTITSIWWSCGDGNQAFTYAENFRSGPRCFNNWSICKNGVGLNAPAGNLPLSGMLGLWFLSPADNIDAPFYVAVPVTTYLVNSPLVIDALIGWQYRIQAQLWDAFQQTGPLSLDSVAVFQDDDVYGRNFTFPAQVWNSSYYSSLRLLTESPNAGGTGAYIYGGGARG